MNSIIAEAECLSCHHSYWDHEGRFDLEERERIRKHREIGCRVCGCGEFKQEDSSWSCTAFIGEWGSWLGVKWIHTDGDDD